MNHAVLPIALGKTAVMTAVGVVVVSVEIMRFVLKMTVVHLIVMEKSVGMMDAEELVGNALRDFYV